MLGRHHVALSTGTVLPFLVPLFFLGNPEPLQYSFAFLIAILIGSLTPDADCGGKSKLHYDFQAVAILMKPIQWITIKFFQHSKVKDKLKVKHEVKKEHRGIMHSPIGVLISSFLLTIFISILLILFNLFDIIFLVVIFFGLFIGQLLHLLQDSCTVTGINWGFPFGKRELKGRIYTWGKDPRPKMYSFILGTISFGLILAYSFDKMNISLWILYPLLFVVLSIVWIIFYFMSKK